VSAFAGLALVCWSTAAVVSLVVCRVSFGRWF
jgi:hypothetical protein